MMEPVQALDVEVALLNYLVMDPECWPFFRDRLRDDDFTKEEHVALLRAFRGCYAIGVRPDVITLSAELERQEIDEGLRSAALMVFSEGTQGYEYEAYFDILRDKNLRRKALVSLTEIATDVYRPSEPLETTVSKAISMFSAIKFQEDKRSPFGALMEMVEAGKLLPRLKTGWTDLDALISGLKNRELTILGARPKMGKTSILANLATHAIYSGMRVGVVSLEMGDVSFVARMVSGKAGIPFTSMVENTMTDEDRRAFYYFSGQMDGLDLVIDDTPGRTASDIVALATRWHMQRPLDLLIIDHIHEFSRLDVPREIAMSHDLAYGWMVEQMQNNLCRKEGFGFPIICAAQLNRNSEARQDKRPAPGDLKYSGTLEQKADAVWLLHRDDYYHPETSERKHIMEIIVPLNRSGPSGTVDLYWDSICLRAMNLSRITINLLDL